MEKKYEEARVNKIYKSGFKGFIFFLLLAAIIIIINLISGTGNKDIIALVWGVLAQYRFASYSSTKNRLDLFTAIVAAAIFLFYIIWHIISVFNISLGI